MKIHQSFKNLKYYIMAAIGNSNFLAKTIVIGFIWLIVSIPFDLYFITMFITRPEGFWQHFALAAVFIVTLGWLQALACFVGIIITAHIMFES